jgi:N-acetylmuramoyl-L-alanine amidase
MPLRSAIERLCSFDSGVSAHYLISQEGTIFRMVEDERKAWHAGASDLGGVTDINDCSIGIELDNLGDRAYTAHQMSACVELCNMLVQKYDIDRRNLWGHSDVAPWRKIDPGPFFDWEFLFKHGFGISLEASSDLDSKPLSEREDSKGAIFRFGDKRVTVYEIQQNLFSLGYKVKLNGIFDLDTNYAVRAFLLHFQRHKLKDKTIEALKDIDTRYLFDLDSFLKLKRLAGYDLRGCLFSNYV